MSNIRNNYTLSAMRLLSITDKDPSGEVFVRTAAADAAVA